VTRQHRTGGPAADPSHTALSHTALSHTALSHTALSHTALSQTGCRDAGSITLFLAPLVLAILAVAGLVYDGGAKLTAGRRADSLAQEAARAGAEQIDTAGQRGTAPSVRHLDPALAARAAQTYLAQAGETGSAVVTGPDTIAVTVTITQPTALLSLVGIRRTSVTGHAAARLAHGIIREEP